MPCKKGSVTILCSTTEEQTQLEAQLDLLDPLHRPNLLAGGGQGFADASSRLAI
jgi:putative ATPase